MLSRISGVIDHSKSRYVSCSIQMLRNIIYLLNRYDENTFAMQPPLRIIPLQDVWYTHSLNGSLDGDD